MEIHKFSLFDSFREISHGSFFREGGVSQSPFDSLNLSFQVGDDPNAVEENRKKVARAIGVDKVIFPSLVHGTSVLEVTGEDQFLEADAIYTRQKGIGIGVTHADCQAALFFDPIQKIVGALHAGWRGQVKGIYETLVSSLKEKEGVLPENLYVSISPSLGPQFAEFQNYKKEIPQKFWRFQESPFHFNLWEMAKFQLMEVGIPEKQIEIARICTFENHKKSFSYRRDQKSGRNASVIALKKGCIPS